MMMMMEGRRVVRRNGAHSVRYSASKNWEVEESPNAMVIVECRYYSALREDFPTFQGSLRLAVVSLVCWHVHCQRCWLQQLVNILYLYSPCIISIVYLWPGHEEGLQRVRAASQTSGPAQSLPVMASTTPPLQDTLYPVSWILYFLLIEACRSCEFSSGYKIIPIVYLDI